jgi:hypothetical protein
MPIRKIEAGRVITVASNNWVGPYGTIWYDETLGDLRIGDDITPGGRQLTFSGGGNTGTSTPLTVSLIGPDYTLSNIVTNVTKLRFDSDAGFDVVDLGSGEVKISMNSTFKYWHVDGQDHLTAEGIDHLKLAAGPGIAITTDPYASTQTVTFSVLPATTATLGGVKAGNNVNITQDGTISVTQGDVINKVVDIPDVNSTTLTNGSLLVYNGGASRWDTKNELSIQVIDGGEF